MLLLLSSIFNLICISITVKIVNMSHNNNNIKVVYSCISWSWMQPGFTLLFSWANCHFASLYLNWDVLRLGRIQDFTEGGSIVGLLKAVPCRWVRGHPRKFKSSEMWFPTFWGLVMVFWGLVNVILINIYNLFDVSSSNLGGSTETPEPP